MILQEGPDRRGKMRQWAALSGPLFKNEYAKAEYGQQKFTGLTDLGDQQFEAYVQLNRDARADKDKRQFEKDHLAWFKQENGIECSTYEAEMARRSQAAAKADIAKDTEEEKKFDDSLLFGHSDGDDSSSGSDSD